MKSIVLQLVFLAAISFAITSQAKVEKVLEITTDSDPNLVAEMSIEVSPNGKPNSVHYLPDANENIIKKFSIDQLLTDKVSLLTKTQVSIISVQLNKLSETAYDFNIIYLHQFKLLGSQYKTRRFNASFSAPDNRYIIRDTVSQKMVSKLHLLTNYGSNGKEVGIAKIDAI